MKGHLSGPTTTFVTDLLALGHSLVLIWATSKLPVLDICNHILKILISIPSLQTASGESVELVVGEVFIINSYLKDAYVYLNH